MINERGNVMTIDGNIDTENRNIVSKSKDGKINQLFDLIYVD